MTTTTAAAHSRHIHKVKARCRKNSGDCKQQWEPPVNPLQLDKFHSTHSQFREWWPSFQPLELRNINIKRYTSLSISHSLYVYILLVRWFRCNKMGNINDRWNIKKSVTSLCGFASTEVRWQGQLDAASHNLKHSTFLLYDSNAIISVRERPHDNCQKHKLFQN